MHTNVSTLYITIYELKIGENLQEGQKKTQQNKAQKSNNFLSQLHNYEYVCNISEKEHMNIIGDFLPNLRFSPLPLILNKVLFKEYW